MGMYNCFLDLYDVTLSLKLCRVQKGLRWPVYYRLKGQFCRFDAVKIMTMDFERKTIHSECTGTFQKHDLILRALTATGTRQ